MKLLDQEDDVELEVEIIPVEKFNVKINGKSIGEFEVESTWEGMVKMKGDNGVIIASDERTIVGNIFSQIFDKEKQSSFTVVKITPSLIPFDSLEK